ncbi:MAG: PAS domain-containing sensor histidine kinase [Daejeonella sp.]|uniref:PAS domain-containing sensor histidine kinase n=1 Tax=Daejeonella sp. TaxID=2805397 RepID=UPI003C7755CD
MKTYNNISFVYDRDQSSLVFIDDSFCGLLKKGRDQIEPETMLSYIHSDDIDYLSEKYSELTGNSLIDDVEFRIIIDGEHLWVKATPFLIKTDQENLIVVKVMDITAERNSIENISKYANKKNSILNMLAHDLRGPLVIANSLTKAINSKVNDPALIKLTKSISGILDQSVNLIVNLVNRELLDAVNVELSLERVDIALKVDEYIEECKRSDLATDREFRFTTSRDSIYLEVDEAKFMQIMNNLVGNALKFTHPGALITMDIKDREDSVIFSLSDTGIGIPNELQNSIFDKFTKARRTGLNGELTTGLGLSIVKMIIEWHKGRIWFESQEGVGTTFFFEIPKGKNEIEAK